MNSEFVKQKKEERRPEHASLAKDSNARRAPIESKGGFHSAQGPNPRVPCGQKKAPDTSPAPAKDQRTQGPPRGLLVTRKASGGPEKALRTARTRRAPEATEEEIFRPPEVQGIRKVELVRVNCMYTLRITRYFNNAQ